MDYPIQVPVLEFAQLALDVYDDPDANDVRPGFNKAWAKLNTWTSMNQFHATFYKNMVTNVGVLSIRGTVTSIFPTLIADSQYGIGEFDSKNMSQFTDAIKFYIFLQTYPLWKETKEKYVTGHSLGGMLSKALAPITGLNTIAFNSPGMNKFLKENNFSSNLVLNQKQITYSATYDTVGNLLNLYDNGKYILVDTPKENDTKLNELNLMHFHGMKLMYNSIKNGPNKNDYF